jgi:radical SAM superfamily enzyme YgiQ (UPF0313 family)
MKTILSHGYFLEEDRAEQKIMMPYPPQGLLHIHAYLSQHGIPVSVFDTTFSSFSEMTSHLKQEKPDALGLYCNLVTRINIVKIVQFIRNDNDLRNMKVILGGPDVSHHREEYLSAGADVCVIGEGEETLRELLDGTMERWDDLSKVMGIAYTDLDVISTPDRPLVKNLDSLPFPDLDQVPVQKYLDAWKERHGYTSLTVSTMRGCPYTCRWCSKAVFGNTYRRRSPASVVKELARRNEKYHPGQYWFVDDVFTISGKWLEEFREELALQKVKINYECITRADCMDEEIIMILRDTGCRRLWIGAESGSQKVLDLMDRRVQVEQVREMIIKSRNAGIETGTFLMLGYPGEALADIRETLRHLERARPDLLTLTLAYPIKGTAFYEEVEAALSLTVGPEANNTALRGPWGTYSDRELEYERPYSKSFYRHAVRYLHHGYLALKAKHGLNALSLSRYLKHRFLSCISLAMMKTFRKNGSA